MNGNSASHASQPLPLRCAEVAPYLSAYADGELAEPLRSQVAVHLTTCEDCTAQLARYHAIDAALARLPRTSPSAEVFEHVAAAVSERPGEPAVRESLGGRLRTRRRMVELPAWAEEPEAPVPARRSGVPRWAAAALPTAAAILLVALTAFALRGLGWHPPQQVQTVASPPAAIGAPLAQTHSAMQAAVAGKSMPFTPVEPTYVPPVPAFQGVSAQVSADPSGNGALYLDVTWKLNGPVTQVHLREGPKSSAWYGYTRATTSGLTWQAGRYQWTPLALQDGSGRPAVGEMRDGDNMWLALDVTPASDRTQTASLTQMLMLVSLSMDLPYQPLPMQQIIPAPSNEMFHYKGQLSSGGTLEAYSYPSQNALHVEVTRSDGTHYVDIVRDQQGIRLDPDHKRYQQRAPSSLTQAALDQSATILFSTADSMARSGELWYLGTAKYNGEDVYDFVLVDARNTTHLYVDQHSNAVVAVGVDPGSSEHPGGQGATSRFASADGCTNYSLIESVAPSPTVSFDPTPPLGYTQGDVPVSSTCAGGSAHRAKI